VRRHTQGLPHSGDRACCDDVEAVFARATGVPGIQQRKEEGKEVERACEEQGLYAWVAEGLHDGGEEVCEGHGDHGRGLDEDKEWLDGSC